MWIGSASVRRPIPEGLLRRHSRTLGQPAVIPARQVRPLAVGREGLQERQRSRHPTNRCPPTSTSTPHRAKAQPGARKEHTARLDAVEGDHHVAELATSDKGSRFGERWCVRHSLMPEIPELDQIAVGPFRAAAQVVPDTEHIRSAQIVKSNVGSGVQSVLVFEQLAEGVPEPLDRRPRIFLGFVPNPPHGSILRPLHQPLPYPPLVLTQQHALPRRYRH